MESFLNFILVVLMLNAIVFYNSGPNHLHLLNYRKKCLIAYSGEIQIELEFSNYLIK